MSDLVVVAQIAGQRVAVDAAKVQSVIVPEDIVAVPHTQPHVLGVTALRSRPLTVIDTSLAIGKAGCKISAESRALVIEEEGYHYALVVEEVFDVIDTEGATDPVPGDLATGWKEIGRALVETGEGPALLIEPAALLGLKSEMAA